MLFILVLPIGQVRQFVAFPEHVAQFVSHGLHVPEAPNCPEGH